MEMLDKYEFTLRVLSPLYMSGIKERTEWRAPSVKGLMRWWFRVVGGSKEEEGKIFGMAGDKEAKASPFILRCYEERVGGEKYEKPFPYFGFSLKNRECISANSLLKLEVLFYPAVSEEIKRKVLSSLWLAVKLGGFGSRARRLYGSLEFARYDKEKTKKLFGDSLIFSPFTDIRSELPNCLNEIAKILNVKSPLPLEIYLKELEKDLSEIEKGKRLTEFEELYRDYRKKIAKPERRQALGMPLGEICKGYRMASQMIFKKVNEQTALITIILDFELSDDTWKALKTIKETGECKKEEVKKVVLDEQLKGEIKEEMLKLMRDFCEKEIYAEKIYPPKQGG